jgi:hypothetical protein
MKVKYVKYRRMHTSTVLNPIYWSDENKDPHLTLGQVYEVFMLRIAHTEGKTNHVIICADEKYPDPASYELSNFEIVDNNIQGGWVVTTGEKMTDIHPRELNWDFWEKYYDGDEAAEALFEQVYQRMTQS